MLCTGAGAPPCAARGDSAASSTCARSPTAAHQAAPGPAARAVIVGGGYIGLEVAASLRKLGARGHRGRGAGAGDEPRRGAAGIRVLRRRARAPRRRDPDRHRGRRARQAPAASSAWSRPTAGRFAADLVVIGIGAVPNDELAREAGLEVDNGIVVDALRPHQRSGDLRRRRRHQPSERAVRAPPAPGIGAQRHGPGQGGGAQRSWAGRRPTPRCPGSGPTSTT